MFRKIDIWRSVRFGVMAAVAFSIPLYFYIRDTTYSASWLLYLGSFFFFIVIILFTLLFNQARAGNANTVTMVFASHVATIIGVILSAVMCFLLLAIMIPGYLNAGPAAVASPDTPINAVHDKTNGLSFRSFIGALLLNFCFGSFASIMFPFTARRDQTRDSGETVPLHDNKAS